MNHSVTKLVSIEFAGQAVGKLFEYGLTVLIARLLGADGLGAFAFGLVVLRLSGAVARVGLDTAVQKFVPMQVTDHRRLTGTVVVCLVTPLVVGTVVALTVFVVAGVSGVTLRPVTVVLLFGIPFFAVFRVSEAATRAFKETKYAVYVREFGQRGSAVVLTAVAIYLFSSVQAAAGAYVVSLAIGGCLGLVFLHRLGAFEGLGRPTFDARSIYAFSLPAMVISVSHPVILWTDVLVLGILVPSATVGIYEAAYQTSLLSTFALVAVSAIFPTLASEYYQSGETERLDRLFELVTKWVITLTLFVTGYLLVFSEEILGIFGAEFVDARLTLFVLVLAQTASVATGPVNYLLSMTDHERLEMINTTFTAALNVGLNVVLVRAFGILGAATATAISIVLLDLVRLVQVYVLLGIFPYRRRQLRNALPLGVAFLVMLASSSVELIPVGRLLLGGVCSFAVFGALVLRFSISEEDAVLLEPVK